MAIRLLIICVALFSALGLKAQVKETVLFDKFADNSSGWTEGSVMYEYIASIHSGKYCLEYQKSRGSHIFDIPLRMDLSRNYFIEATGQISEVGKVKGAAFGIVWGKGKGGHLVFAVTEDGSFFVRSIAGRNAEYLIGPTSSKYVLLRKPNKLRVQYLMSGGLTFFINNKYVGCLPPQKCYGQNAGIVLYGRQRTEVYDFGAYGSKNFDVLPGYNASIMVSHYEIEDGFDENGEYLGNGDCKVQPGEIVQLSVFVQNMGPGRCQKMKAKFFAISDFVTLVDQDAEQSIGPLDRQQSQRVSLKFKVDNKCSLDKLSFYLDIISSNGLLAESVPMSVPLYTKITPINKESRGKISLTFNFRDDKADDINTFFPITLQNSRSCAAVVVGVEGYSHLPKAIYATNDAKVAKQYFLKVLNMSQVNVIALSNQSATLERLANILKPGGELSLKGKANVIFYFSGLSVCDPGGREPYIMLYDSKDTDPQGTGYSVKEIVRNLHSAVPGCVICIFETSFAGLDRAGKPIGESAREPLPYCILPAVADERTCLIYAASGKAYNPVVERSSHGMLTHYLLSAIQEYAKNRNALDMKNLFNYISRGMDQEAQRAGITDLQPRMDCVNRDGILILK